MLKITELYSAKQVQDRVSELGEEISRDYCDVDRLVVIGVLKGSICFLADLVRKIKTSQPLQIEFVRLSSYGDGTESSGVVQAPYLD